MFRRKTLPVEVHLQAFEKLQPEPRICSKLILQSTLDSRHQAKFVGFFFPFGWYHQGARKPTVTVFVYNQHLVRWNLATYLFPLLGALPKRWWCWDNSSFLVVTQISAGDEISISPGHRARTAVVFLTADPWACSHTVFPGSSATLQCLAYCCWRSLVCQQKADFIPQSGFM